MGPMSIYMERFSAEGEFPTYDPCRELLASPQATVRVRVFTLQCHSCGFEAGDVTIAPVLCPKCHGNSWERVVRPGSILAQADRHVA